MRVIFLFKCNRFLIYWTLLASAVFLACLEAKRSYEGYALYNVKADSESQLSTLQQIWNGSEEMEVDFWQHPTHTGSLIEILVSPEDRPKLQASLDRAKIHYYVTNENIQGAIDEELRKDFVVPPRGKTVMKSEAYFNFSQYNTWAEIEKYVLKLPNLFPDLVRTEAIGQSHENRDLILVKIGSNAIEGKKPAIWIDAGIHAREWISSATILYIIDSILTYYEGDDTIQRYLDNIDWYFLPMMNPDGYAFSHAKDRMWRKNRSPAVCKGRKCCQGVDLNRNFATQWGVAGASKNPCSEVFLGPKPFSEPETRAVRDFVLSNADSIKAYFTFHSYGQLWLYPFGYKKRTYPEDVEDLRKISLSAVENMKAVHGTKYKVGTAANILYPSSGGADDWAKSEANIKYVFSIELRPVAGKGNGFLVHPRHIIPSGEETWAGIRAVADKILSTTEEPKTTTPPEPEDYEVETTTRRTNKPKLTTTTSSTSTSTTSAPAQPERTTTVVEEEKPNVEEETEGGPVEEDECVDLSTRCETFSQDDLEEKCKNNVVKALCRKLCKLC